MFSNARRVLSQCNTRLRLLYLLNIVSNIYKHKKPMKPLTKRLVGETTGYRLNPPTICPPPKGKEEKIIKSFFSILNNIEPRDDRPSMAWERNDEFISRQIVCTTWRTMFAPQLRSEEKRTNRTLIIGRRTLKVNNIQLGERVRQIRILQYSFLATLQVLLLL